MSQLPHWLTDPQTFLQLVENSNTHCVTTTSSTNHNDGSTVFTFPPHNTHIPQIAHFIWIGSSAIPVSATLCIQRFQQLHPTWHINLWTDLEIPSFFTIFIESVKSNQLLSSLPRIYSYLTNPDIDYEFVQSLDPLLQSTSATFICGYSHTSIVEEINNGVLLSTPRHSFLTLILETVLQSLSKVLPNPMLLTFMTQAEIQTFLQALNVESPMGIISHTGPGMLTKCLDKFLKSAVTNIDRYGNDAKVLVTSREVFHPIPNNIITSNWSEYLQSNLALNRLESPSGHNHYDNSISNTIATNGEYVQLLNQYLTSETIAIHWWQKSWQQK